MKRDQIFPEENLADEELALLVQQEDKDAFSVLSHRYDALLKSRAARYAGIAGIETEDFFQEGLIALYRAARGYHPGGAARFRTYAVTCINNSMTAAVKLHVRQQRCQNLLSAEQLGCVAIGEGMEAGRLDGEEPFGLSDQIQSGLSELERKVLRGYLSGYSYQHISQVLSISAKTVDNALQRVRRKLRLRSQ